MLALRRDASVRRRRSKGLWSTVNKTVQCTRENETPVGKKTKQHSNSVYFIKNNEASFNITDVAGCQMFVSDKQPAESAIDILTNDAGFIVHAGRHKQKKVSDWFLKGLTNKAGMGYDVFGLKTHNDMVPQELNFAFKGDISFQILYEGQVLNPTCVDMRIAQGSNGNNNWWVGCRSGWGCDKGNCTSLKCYCGPRVLPIQPAPVINFEAGGKTNVFKVYWSWYPEGSGPKQAAAKAAAARKKAAGKAAA